MKLNRILCSLVFAMFVGTMWGAVEQALIVQMNNGETHEYWLNDSPELTYSADNLNVKSQDVDVSYPLADIAQAYFEDKERTSVELTKSETFKFVYLDNQHIEISTAEPVGTIAVYDINGRTVGNYKLSDNKCTVDVSAMQAGVYVIRVKNQSIKILKK